LLDTEWIAATIERFGLDKRRQDARKSRRKHRFAVPRGRTISTLVSPGSRTSSARFAPAAAP